MTREEAIQRFNGIIRSMSISVAQAKFYPTKAELNELCDMAIEALQREDEFLKNIESNEPQFYDEDDYWNGRVPTHGILIDADALYASIAKDTYLLTDRINSRDYGMFLVGIKKKIDNAPTVQADRPHGEWIPVTERLPEIDETAHICDKISEEVLGTDTYGNIRHVYLTNCGYLKPTFCTVEEGMSVNIVAWMALPEPYEEASDGKTKNTV